MCGIAGVFGDGAAEYREAVRKMVNSMAHRGPDGEGIYVSQSGNCVLGHRRLAVLDLSEAAAQPMISSDGSKAFVYNGECYNFLALRKELKENGENFVSSGDTEVVLRLISRNGVSVFRRLNAMFALGLWDERNQTLVLARDRYGQKPLYFARVGNLVIFASEVRALLACGLISRRIDPDAVYSYLAYGAVQEPSTIVSGISIVKPGTYMVFEPGGKERLETYWSYPTKKEKITAETLRERFSLAVKRHLVSDAPLGLFLSGGIDSSAMVAAAAFSMGKKINTLSVVFPDQPEQSEAEYAALAANKSGTEHREVPVTGQQVLEMLPKILDAIDQPTGDAVNTYIVSQAASQAGFKVALSGLGGDELFGGYPSFRDVPRMLRLRRLFVLAKKPLSDLMEYCDLFSIKLSKLAEIFDAPADVLGSYLVRRRLFSSRQIKKMAPELASQGWDSGLDKEYYLALQMMLNGHEIHDAVGLLEMRNYMGQMLLRDADVMGMAHGLEIRLPFLDTEFSSCALALEPDARIQSPRSKWRFIEAMGDWLPQEILCRPKWGFTMPFKNWMLYELKKDVFDGILSLPHACNVIRKNVLVNLWEKFCAQPERTGWFRLWSLFVLGRYLEKHRLEM